MRTQERNLLIAVLIVLLTAAGIIWWFSPPIYSWDENYFAHNKGPFGTKILVELLRNRPNAEDGLTLVKPRHRGPLFPALKGANYVFVGMAPLYDSVMVRKLLHFVGRGNTAIICSRTLPDQLLQQLMDTSCNGSIWKGYLDYQARVAYLNLRHPNLRRPQHVAFGMRDPKGSLEMYEWSYFDDRFFCDDPAGFLPLGFLMPDRINFVRRPYRKGWIYLHSNPLAFSNLHLRESEKLAYAQGVFAHLSAGPIIWDEKSKASEDLVRRNNGEPPRRAQRFQDRTPLEYILQQPPLAWAWYLLISLGLLFLLFRTKRVQRLIPVLEPNTNTSLELVKNIGRLYFLQNNHFQLVQQKLRQWQLFVRERYGVVLRAEQMKDWPELLAEKTGVSPEVVHPIVSHYQTLISQGAVDDQGLIAFHQKIETFYQKCQ